MIQRSRMDYLSHTPVSSTQTTHLCEKLTHEEKSRSDNWVFVVRRGEQQRHQLQGHQLNTKPTTVPFINLELLGSPNKLFYSDMKF